MVFGAKVCELTDGFLWFVCGLYVGILTSSLSMFGQHGIGLFSCTTTYMRRIVPTEIPAQA